MRILVFDSDIYHYHRLRGVVENCDSEYEVIGPFTTVEQARDYLSQFGGETDIIITDTLLSDDEEVFSALDYAPRHVPIIFCTAHEEYALRAFSYLSLSYLPKAIDDEALTQALSKAIRLRRGITMLTPQGGWTKGEKAKSKIVARTLHGTRIIHVATIRYIVSEQRTTYVKLLDDSSYRLDKNLEQTENMLGSKFMRVNRKYIVPIDQVHTTENIENGKMLLTLKGKDAPRIIVSRTRKVDVCKWLVEN